MISLGLTTYNSGIGLVNSSHSYSEKLEKLEATFKINAFWKKLLKKLTSKLGLKCLEKMKGKDQYHLKHQKLFIIKLDGNETYETLHNVTRNHYKRPAKIMTYLGDCKGQSIETTFKDAPSFAFIQRDKKQLLQLYYQKSFSKLQFDILLEEIKKLSSSSDDEDFYLDTTDVPPFWNLSFINNILSHNAKNFFINLAETSDQEQLTSVTHVGGSNHSMTCIKLEKSKRLFCKNCTCTYTATDGTCLRCETDKSYEKT